MFENGELLGDNIEIAPELHTCSFRLFFPAVARRDSGWTQFAGLFDSQGDCVSLVNSIERAS